MKSSLSVILWDKSTKLDFSTGKISGSETLAMASAFLFLRFSEDELLFRFIGAKLAAYRMTCGFIGIGDGSPLLAPSDC